MVFGAACGNRGESWHATGCEWTDDSWVGQSGGRCTCGRRGRGLCMLDVIFMIVDEIHVDVAVSYVILGTSLDQVCQE